MNINVKYTSDETLFETCTFDYTEYESVAQRVLKKQMLDHFTLYWINTVVSSFSHDDVYSSAFLRMVAVAVFIVVVKSKFLLDAIISFVSQVQTLQ